jgi:hypothetical protein
LNQTLGTIVVWKRELVPNVNKKNWKSYLALETKARALEEQTAWSAMPR